METKIFYISDKSGEITIVYCISLTAEEIEKFCNYCGIEVVDVGEIKQEDFKGS